MELAPEKGYDICSSRTSTLGNRKTDTYTGNRTSKECTYELAVRNGELMDEICRDDLRHESQHDGGHHDGIYGLAAKARSQDLRSYDKKKNIYYEIGYSHRNAGSIHKDGCKSGNAASDEVIRKEKYAPTQRI